MIVKEIEAKSILSKSQIYDYALNAYVGCQHRCLYCYAKFMKRFTGHREPWGDFVDAKINAPELLAEELRKKRKKGRVWISGVCDPYQPLEKKYRLTRRCLEILINNNWRFTIQTKSPLVVRDINLLRKADCEVGFTIATADERIRAIFEPGAPPIAKRVEALGILHSEGIATFVMIAPMLPGAEALVGMLKDRVDHVLIDRYNYHYADWAFKKHGMQWAVEDEFFDGQSEKLNAEFQKEGITCSLIC
jgi:DNA repair photolyase